MTSRPRVDYFHGHTGRLAETWKHERPDLRPSDYLYLIYANRVGRILEAVDDKHCRSEYGISAVDMRVLFALRRAPPDYAMRPTQLFRSLLVTSGAITKQVDRLAAGGFVSRQPGPAKSGGFLIQLTGKGFKAADSAFTSLVHSSIASMTTLTVEERNQFCRLLEKMMTDLEGRLEEYKKLGGPARSKAKRAD